MPRLIARLKTAPPVIFPFNDDARALLFGGPTLRALQDDEARAAGCAIVDVDEDAPLPAGTVALLAADVVVNAAALTRLLSSPAGGAGLVQAAVARGTPLWRCSTRLLDDDAVPSSSAGDLLVPLVAGDLSGRPASFAALSGSATDRVMGSAGGATPLVVADEAGAVVVDVRPYGPPPHQLHLADVERLLGRPTHWLHVLELSLAALQTRLRQHRRGGRGRVVRLGTGKERARVHPTAYVDNCVLGPKSVVEAHASVVDSVVGADVIVADHTVVHGSVIGERCRTLVDTHLRRVVAMPGSTLSNLDMQDAIFGREIFLTTGVAFFADGPGRNVVVDGTDSGRAVLSGAIGARAVLGSRALFASGVALPAQALVVARAGEAIGKLDEASLARSSMRLGDRARDV